jgi:hypothetical protein
MISKSRSRRRAAAAAKRDPKKQLTNALRKKGLEMVLLDSEFGGQAYTFQPIKPGSLSNSDVATRLFYAGEVAKWSPLRRKFAEKAEVKKTKKVPQAVEVPLKEESSTEEAESSGSEKGSSSGSD